MKNQEPLYTVDHNKMLLNAVREIKEHCSKMRVCADCQFYDHSKGCLLNTYPAYWEV